MEIPLYSSYFTKFKYLYIFVLPKPAEKMYFWTRLIQCELDGKLQGPSLQLKAQNLKSNCLPIFCHILSYL